MHRIEILKFGTSKDVFTHGILRGVIWAKHCRFSVEGFFIKPSRDHLVRHVIRHGVNATQVAISKARDQNHMSLLYEFSHTQTFHLTEIIF